MLTKRDKLLIRPWIDQRFQNHRRKVQSAGPAIDLQPPTNHPHVTTKLKKAQKELERREQIEKENLRLLQKLGSIMTRKRIENYWSSPRPNFLSREHLYIIQPKTSKVAVVDPFPLSSFKLQTLPRGTYARCSACSGKPIKSNQLIQEERMPYQPVKKTINRKLLNDPKSVHQCCRYCC